LLFSAAFLCGQAQSTDVFGTRFQDSNGNGRRDADEPGIKGVAVSDQVSVVTSDAEGKYHFRAAGNGFVFISVPNNFSTHSFYKRTSSTAIDFALTPLPPHNSFVFIHGSDTHISEKSLDRMQKFRAAIDSIKPDFVILTGDLVKDALRVGEKEATGYYNLLTGELKKINFPVWPVPGNHENFGIERHLSLVSKDHPLYGRKMYHAYLGPDYYSFNYGGILFIGLNALDFEDLFYFGSIDSVQEAWLKKDLAVLPPSTPVVTFQHVPFFTGGLSLEAFEEDGLGRTLERENGKLQFRHVVSNAQAIVGLLLQHPYPLALAGHYHSRQRFYLETSGQQTRFEQAAAIVAPSDAGAFKMPSGITVYRVKNGTISAGEFVKF
jgi:hypothetical protein